jgi:CNT family concentrative nucleoside transporter
MPLQGLLGVLALLAIACLLSENRKAISWRLVGAGCGLQLLIAAACLRVPGVVDVFDALARGFTKVISFADEGTAFLFGKAADASQPWGFIFAIKVLPIIIFFAAFMAVLYHLRIMQVVVAGVAWVLRKALGLTGVEALSAAANIFVGQTEAPLTVKPYLSSMTRSQIMAVMVGGFATIAGSVMAAYVGMLGGDSEESRVLFAKHLLTASVMSAPAGLVMAKIMVPETQSPRDENLSSLLSQKSEHVNVIDAAAAGATDGLKLALNVAAMLAAFVALIALLNWPLSAIDPRLSFQSILGTLLQPLAWALGVPWQDARPFGALLGTQVVATEFKAYLDLTGHIQNGTMSSRASQVATYALCGFANLASIAIQIGGLSALAPDRRADFVRLAPRAMLAGAFACWMTAAWASVLI